MEIDSSTRVFCILSPECTSHQRVRNGRVPGLSAIVLKYMRAHTLTNTQESEKWEREERREDGRVGMRGKTGKGGGNAGRQSKGQWGTYRNLLERGHEGRFPFRKSQQTQGRAASERPTEK